MTSAGYVVIGMLIGGIIAYVVGAVRQIQGKDQWLRKLVERFDK